MSARRQQLIGARHRLPRKRVWVGRDLPWRWFQRLGDRVRLASCALAFGPGLCLSRLRTRGRPDSRARN
jgi:hypothetical protein